METETTTQFSSNQWVHLAVSIDRDNNNVKLFANGNLLKDVDHVPINMNQEDLTQLSSANPW